MSLKKLIAGIALLVAIIVIVSSNAISIFTHPKSTTLVYGPLTPDERELIGKDEDGNGVRDDVDAWIKKTYSDEKTRAAVTLDFQWLTWGMLKGYRSHSTDPRDMNALNLAHSCALELSHRELGENSPKSEDAEAILFNTRDRADAFLAWDAGLSRAVNTISKTACDEAKPVTQP